jgi:hypothetical protein
MSGVFRNIDPHPLTARRVSSLYPPPLVRGRTHSLGSEDAGHFSVLYICKYFVLSPLCFFFFRVLFSFWGSFCILRGGGGGGGGGEPITTTARMCGLLY